jgi:predicted PurR-regulated permease PerM
VCLVVVPVFLFASALIDEGVRSFDSIYEWVLQGGLERILSSKYIQEYRSYVTKHMKFIDLSSFDVQSHALQYTKLIGQYLLSKGTELATNIVDLVVRFFLIIFVLFYLFKDGKTLKNRFYQLIPLSHTQMDKIFERFQELTRQTLMGTLLTALAQGLVGGIALAIAGLPALFWGTMMAVASLIPVVGTSIIWIPATIYLAFNASLGLVIFYALWNIILVGSIDNFLRPYLIGGDTGLSTLVLFLAILGGISLFGIIGIFYGPLIFGLCEVLLYLYEIENEEYLKELSKQ